MADESHHNTNLVKHNGTIAELIRLYEHLLRNETTTYVCLVKNQSREYRKMMDNCDENCVIVHVDLKHGNANIVLRYNHAILVRTSPNSICTLACTTQKMKRLAFALCLSHGHAWILSPKQQETSFLVLTPSTFGLIALANNIKTRRISLCYVMSLQDSVSKEQLGTSLPLLTAREHQTALEGQSKELLIVSFCKGMMLQVGKHSILILPKICQCFTPAMFDLNEHV